MQQADKKPNIKRVINQVHILKLASESQLYEKINIQVHIFEPNSYFNNKPKKLQLRITLILQKVHSADSLSQQKSTYIQWQHGLINTSKAAQVASLLKLLMQHKDAV